AAARPCGVAASVTIPSAEPSETIHVVVAPVKAESAVGIFAEPMAMLILGKVAGAVIPDDRLRKAYGLTPAEARLLSALVAGERLSAYAERTQVSITTAKFHLSALFAKTGVRRQTDLIRLALADPVLRLHVDTAMT
ncbi:LuxR C-terminal-related transcriptional regulator, partial [Sphingomonas sp. LaA6.9]